MKFIVALALSAAALTSAAAPPAAELPECAKSCFAQAIAASGCKAEDLDCSCKSKKMAEVITPCVQTGCTTQKDQLSVMRFSIASCASAGIRIAVPGADAAPAPSRTEGEAPAGDAPAPSRVGGDAPAAPPAGDAPAPVPSRADGEGAAAAPAAPGAAGAAAGVPGAEAPGAGAPGAEAPGAEAPGAAGMAPMPSGGVTGAMAPPAGEPGAPAPSGTESAPAVQTANTAALVKGSSVLGFLSALTVLLAF